MKRIIVCAAVAALGFSLGGCGTVLKDLQTCERHYNGNISGGAINPAIFAGSGKIDCCPVGLVANTDHTNCVRPPPLLPAATPEPDPAPPTP